MINGVSVTGVYTLCGICYNRGVITDGRFFQKVVII